MGSVNAFSTSVDVHSGSGNPILISLIVSLGHLVCAIGRDQRLGRWNVEKGARDGIAIIKLKMKDECNAGI